MSIHSIHEYQNEVEKIIHFGGTKKETAIRSAFYNLLNDYAKQKNLMIVPEIDIKATNSNKKVTPDGTLKDILRQDWGYWESKDESDNLDDEIKKKFNKGYPKENILFEDSQTAVLIQNGIEISRVQFSNAQGLHDLITAFISFERPEVRHFRKAIEHFKSDIPKVTATIRKIIINAEETNPQYTKAAAIFLKLCHDSINPDVTIEDIREMIIQHILTEDIFNTIFNETQFHRENNIARELEKVIHTFFTGNTRRIALSSVQHYYQTISAAAAGIVDHHEKQKFLKVVYETFYRSYNPKAADRLGVFYTPNEIVRFMIESTDYLLHKYFNKFLQDKNVEILDPATGTGTFICDLIDYLRKDKLEYKYRNEIHANEVAILPYYISNLNIEFTYAQKLEKYAQFENLCFVDTLDNMGFTYRGKQINMFAPFTEENSKRIKNQNDKKIAVIIGNPPYYANQANENDNNKNRDYPEIDKRIKDTFIKYSTAQKTKMYDMYARFYRWAFDRLDNNGVIAFITNRSFIDSRTFDGFRRTIQEDFEAAYIIDTRSAVKDNPKISGTVHNVFGIKTGVAIMFLVKKKKQQGEVCKIHYVELNDFWKKEQKLQWFVENPLSQVPFEIIRPDKDSNWLNITDNDFDNLLPVCSKDVKSGKSKKALFAEFTIGTNTARDEWVYDFSETNLIKKVGYLIDTYNNKITSGSNYENDKSIKWTRGLKQKFDKGAKLTPKMERITRAFYRPFIKSFLYHSPDLVEMPSLLPKLTIDSNRFIIFSGSSHSKPFQCFITDSIFSFDYLEKTTGVSLFNFDKEGNRVENITDWGYNQFVKQYGKKGVTKETIFHYTYAVLNDPIYRKKYKLNLERKFPRLPFYVNFKQWAEWGKALIELHLTYENAKPYDLKVVSNNVIEFPKVKLKADKDNGLIYLDENTILKGIPKEAWEYKLGNRSALECVLYQYKEKMPSDPTIAEKFNTYKFADYKDHVIDLLKRVCTVSVETMKIIEEMKKLQPHET